MNGGMKLSKVKSCKICSYVLGLLTKGWFNSVIVVIIICEEAILHNLGCKLCNYASTSTWIQILIPKHIKKFNQDNDRLSKTMEKTTRSKVNLNTKSKSWSVIMKKVR
jgi:hypothetical protein